LNRVKKQLQSPKLLFLLKYPGQSHETAFCLDKSDVGLEHIPLVYRSVTKEERLAIVE